MSTLEHMRTEPVVYSRPSTTPVGRRRSPVRRSPLVVLLSALSLAGCDNFRESVTTDTWKSSVIVEAPAPSFAGFETGIETTVRTEGSAAPIRPGDLVQLRYTRTVTWDNKTEHADRPEVVWVWTGREPDPGMEFWGKFGSPELRTTLLGRKVGEIFELRGSTDHHEITAPVYGIAGPDTPHRGFNQFIGQYATTDTKTLARGGVAGSLPSWSAVEILAACPAKFGTRRGRMTQWGYVFNMFGTAWQTNRSGELRWSAIEANCPAPNGKVRFMLGPIYWTAEPVVPGMLMAWESTFRSKRPKLIFPEEYAFVTINGRTLPTLP